MEEIKTEASNTPGEETVEISNEPLTSGSDNPEIK